MTNNEAIRELLSVSAYLNLPRINEAVGIAVAAIKKQAPTIQCPFVWQKEAEKHDRTEL